MTVIVALLPYSVSLASHPDAWPYTHRGNCADESIGTLHTSNTGPEPQVYLPLAADAQGLPFFFKGLLHNLNPQQLVRQHPF